MSLGPDSKVTPEIFCRGKAIRIFGVKVRKLYQFTTYNESSITGVKVTNVRSINIGIIQTGVRHLLGMYNKLLQAHLQFNLTIKKGGELIRYPMSGEFMIDPDSRTMFYLNDQNEDNTSFLSGKEFGENLKLIKGLAYDLV